MNQCAIVLNGDDVIKVSNLKRKFSKIQNNSNMKILEECSLERLDEKYNYWKNLLHRKEEKEIEETKMYYFKNHKTGETIVSIYPELDNVKSYIKDWYDYERVDQTENG